MPPGKRQLMTTVDLLCEDIQVLISRMLHENAELFMFGEDGLGQYGRSDHVFRSNVLRFDVSVTADDDEYPSDIHCLLKLYVTGYDSQVQGHAATDGNLKICLDMKFKEWSMDTDAWDWAHITMQGRDYIALNLDVPKLLDWA